jgi:hypothetical protein
MEPNNKTYKHISPIWTIWLPLGLGLLIILGAFALILVSSSSGITQVSLWAQISTIFIAFILIFAGFFLLGLLIVSVVGVQKIANRMPNWLAKVRLFSVINLARIRRFSTILTKPMEFFLTGFSMIKSAWKLLIHKIEKK